jgi:ribose transport system ATP-binding protein
VEAEPGSQRLATAGGQTLKTSYSLIRQLSKEGKTIMIFSSELPEIMNICDSIYLLYDGSLKATLRNGCDVDNENILHIVTGGE